MFYTALLLGLLGSAHCIGMCGPIALALPGFNLYDRLGMFFSALIYNLGRILAYGVIGGIFGLLSQTVSLSGLQWWLSIGIASTLLLLALFSLNPEDFLVRIPFIQRFYQNIQQKIRVQFQKKGLLPYFIIGFLNGWLPCGMVYLAVAGSVVAGSIYQGSLFMLAFGIGTLPLMFLTAMARQFIPRQLKVYLRKASPIILIGFAILIIIRALNIELPAEIVFWEAINAPIMCH